MKIRILFISMLCNLLITATAKNVYTYNLVQTSPQTVIEEQKHYAYPGTSYQFIVNIANYNGFAIGKFKLDLTNGKFSNDSLSMLVENGESVTVTWNDTPNVNAGIKITSTTVYDSQRDSLKAGVKQIMFYKIASLKGQTPVLTYSGNPNQTIGNKQQFTAIVNEMIYPGIMDTTYGVITNRQVKYFQWKLPDGWKTTNGIGGTFMTLSGVRQIDVIPDYVNQGLITVRGVNDLYTGFSETTSFFADRGFLFTNYPTSITFGDNTAKTFGTTLFSGITYEWSAPSGWQINGQGNNLEALNLNNVSVVPTFCTQTDGRVRVRLKKDGDVSTWYDFKNYQGIVAPTIATNNTTFFQYEKSTFTLNNINTANIQSINCTGTGIYYAGRQGTDLNIIFTNTGTDTLNISILMSGCTTPITFKKIISVQPCRISISGSSQICDQSTFIINNFPLGASVTWSTSNDLAVFSGQNTSTAVISRTYNLSLNTYIRATISNLGYVFIVNKTNLQIGTINPLIKIYDSRGRYELAPPYYTNTAYTIVAYGSSFSTNSTDYNWTITPPSNLNLFPSLYNGKQYSYMTENVGNYNISLKYYGECGWSIPTSKNIYFYQNSMQLSMYPSPATDLLTVSVSLTSNSDSEEILSTKKSTKTEPYSIELWNENYGLVKSIDSDDSILQIQLQDLPRGLYFVHLKIKGKTIQRKLLQIK